MTARPRTHFKTLMTCAVLAILALAGCGKSVSQSAAEMAVSAASGGKVDVTQSGDKSQVSIKTDQGTSTVSSGNNVPLPKDFPSDVHLPASYTIKSAIQSGPMTMLVMHTPAAMQALYSEYDGSMKSGGWTEAMAMQSSQSESVLSFQKDRRNVTVSITASTDADGGSDVSLQSVTEQK